MFFISRKGENGGDFQGFIAIFLQLPKRFVIQLGSVHTAHSKQGIKAFAAPLQAVGFLAEIIQDVLGNLAKAIGV